MTTSLLIKYVHVIHEHCIHLQNIAIKTQINSPHIQQKLSLQWKATKSCMQQTAVS